MQKLVEESAAPPKPRQRIAELENEIAFYAAYCELLAAITREALKAIGMEHARDLWDLHSKIKLAMARK